MGNQMGSALRSINNFPFTPSFSQCASWLLLERSQKIPKRPTCCFAEATTDKIRLCCCFFSSFLSQTQTLNPSMDGYLTIHPSRPKKKGSSPSFFLSCGQLPASSFPCRNQDECRRFATNILAFDPQNSSFPFFFSLFLFRFGSGWICHSPALPYITLPNFQLQLRRLRARFRRLIRTVCSALFCSACRTRPAEEEEEETERE